jgi:hypothetical protein
MQAGNLDCHKKEIVVGFFGSTVVSRGNMLFEDLDIIVSPSPELALVLAI